MEEGLRKIEEATKQHNDPNKGAVESPFIYEIFFDDTPDAHTVPVEKATTSHEVCARARARVPICCDSMVSCQTFLLFSVAVAAVQ